jgi:hypothetical protein
MTMVFSWAIYLKEYKTAYNREACTPILIAAVVTITMLGISLSAQQPNG